MTVTQSKNIREAVGVFDTASCLETAIEELEESGFDRAEISLLAGADVVREKLAHIYSRAEEIEDDPNAPRTAFVSTEAIGDAEGALIGGLTYVGALTAAGAVVASGGTVGAVLAATAIGAGSGGTIGATLAALVDKRHADYLHKQIDRGGLLLWVHTPDIDHENRATEILKRNAARDVHVHDIAV